MNDAKLWIDEVGCTATITGTNVSYTMPLWAFNAMRDIIMAYAEKKVEVTHRDFDIQQELLDRYGSENSKLRELVARLMGHVKYPPCDGCSFECDGTDLTRCDEWSFMEADARELGVEVNA